MSDPTHAPITVVEHHEPPERMHPLVHAALQSGTLDPANLRELLAVQREFEAGEARKAFARGLVALKAALPKVIPRDKVVAFTSSKGPVRYTHASLAAVVEAVTGILTAHGFTVSFIPKTEGQSVSITCRLLHADGHSEEATIAAPVDMSGSKSPAQGVASTMTLLQRHCLLSLLGLATADMQEPSPESDDPERIDTARNLRAVGRLTKLGKKREDAEAFIGRPVAEWTAADLERLTQWVKPDTGGAT